MPCYTSPEEIEAYEKDNNKKLYGKLATDAEIIATVACALAKSIRKHKLFEEQESYVKKWILEHEELDAKLAKSKKTEAEKRAIRRAALAKLTPMERKALSI